MIRLKVKNFRRVEVADLELDRIAVVAGLNKAGKMSIVTVARAALMQSTMPPGIDYTQKAAGRLVRRAEGVDMGYVQLTVPDVGETTVRWPACKTHTEGEPPQISNIAAGLTSLVNASAKDRADYLVALLNPIPGKAATDKALAEIGYSGEHLTAVTTALGKAGGWDKVTATATENASAGRAKYEAATGEKWGAKKSADWRPTGWTLDLEEKTDADLQMEEVDAGAAIERLVAAGAVISADVDRLRTTANEGSYQEAAKADLEVELQAAEKILAKIEKERADLPPIEQETLIPCPKCGTHLIYDAPFRNGKPDPHAATLKIGGAPILPDQLRERREERARLDGAFANAQVEVRRVQAKISEADKVIAAGKAARDRLAGLSTDDASVALEEARSALDAAKKRRKLREAVTSGQSIHAAIVRSLALAALAGPEGLRKAALASALAGFNAELAAAAKVAKWPALSVADDLSFRQGDDYLADMAESDVWRAAVLLQVVIAKRRGEPMIVIDRADVNDPQHRQGLLQMLAWSKLHALVCMTMTMKVARTLPDLKKMGFGDIWYLRDGIARRLSEIEEA